MSSRDLYSEELSRLDKWLTHINYSSIIAQIPDREEDVIVDKSSIFIRNVPGKYEKYARLLRKILQRFKPLEILLDLIR